MVPFGLSDTGLARAAWDYRGDGTTACALLRHGRPELDELAEPLRVGGRRTGCRRRAEGIQPIQPRGAAPFGGKASCHPAFPSARQCAGQRILECSGPRLTVWSSAWCRRRACRRAGKAGCLPSGSAGFLRRRLLALHEGRGPKEKAPVGAGKARCLPSQGPSIGKSDRLLAVSLPVAESVGDTCLLPPKD